MPKEKRKHRRLRTMIMADVYNGETFELEGKGFVSDLSESGIAFETNLKLDKKKSFFMRLNVPLEVVCEILHIDEKDGVYQYGVKFIKLEMSDAIKLKKIILEG